MRAELGKARERVATIPKLIPVKPYMADGFLPNSLSLLSYFLLPSPSLTGRTPNESKCHVENWITYRGTPPATLKVPETRRNIPRSR